MPTLYQSAEQQSALPGSESDLLQKQKIVAELSSLHAPCKAVFLWSVLLQDTADSHTSKKVACQDAAPLAIVMKGEWLEGDDKDVLHQIMQYLTNSLSTR